MDKKLVLTVNFFIGIILLILSIILGFILKTYGLANLHFTGNFLDLNSEFFKDFFFYTTLIGDKIVAIIIILSGSIYLKIKNRKRDLYIWLISFIAIVLLATLGKYFFSIPRPENGLVIETGGSYPSWHTTFSVLLSILLYSTFAFRENIRKSYKIIIGLISLIILIVVPYSRLYLGVHWQSDIIGGVLLAFGSYLIIYSSYDLITSRNQ